MCGIVGYIGGRPCRDILFRGLRRLEYRGYDSAGISVIARGRFQLLHSVGNLDRLEAVLHQIDTESTMGMAHTRWATHGRPSSENAHPHVDCSGRFAIVLNGIVENYLSLRAELQAEGHVFTSETDAEVVAHLLERAYDGSLREAVAHAYGEMDGHFTIVAITVEEPDVIVAVRKDTPLVVGIGEDETFVASAVSAFLSETRLVIYPEDGDVVMADRQGVHLFSLDGAEITRPTHEVDWDEEAAEKGGYETFMLKEIHEQPDALSDTLTERVDHLGRVRLDGLGLTDDMIRGIRQVVIVACGTSYHAGLIGKCALERWARVPVDIDVASEFRYRDPVIGPDTLCVAISQSGETADTLAAMRLARNAGAHVVAVTNIVGSQATREADGVLFTRAGLEIGVAATKTFLAQVLAMLLLSLHFADVRGTLDADEGRRLTQELRRVPTLLNSYLESGPLAVIERAANAYRGEPLLPLSGPERGVAGVSRRRAQAEGDLLHPHGVLRGRRDEARPDSPARRGVAGGGRGHRQSCVREGDLEPAGSQGPRGGCDRGGHRRQPGHRADGRRGVLRAPHRRHALAPALRRSPAAVRILRRAGQRGDGRSAPEPGQDRDRGVGA